jgi:outer membrane immunogenic protein
MKKLVLASLLASVALPAIAADQVYIDPTPQAAAPLAAPYDWNGAYIGLHAGYGWGNPNWVYQVGPTVSINNDGFLGGAQAGYNFQTGSIVFGLEGDIAATDMKGASPCPNPAFSCEADINWLGSVRGRVGVAANNMLFYGTGGFGFGGTTIQTVLAGVVTGTTQTRTGYTVGAGMEWGLTPHLTTKFEYLYYDLGSDTYTVDAGLLVNANFKAHTAKVGFNYKF